MRKKILIGFLTVLFVLGCSGCGKKETLSSSAAQEPIKEIVSISETALAMDVYDNYRLTATCNDDSLPIIFVSSDTSVARVDNAGNISAVGVGATTVTVRAGRATASCVVSVKATDIVATLEVNETDIRLTVGKMFDVLCSAKWKNETIKDVSLECVVVSPEDGQVVEIKANGDNSFTIKAKNEGNATVVVFGTVRGTYLARTVRVSVG